jgi:hypothetical protein
VPFTVNEAAAAILYVPVPFTVKSVTVLAPVIISAFVYDAAVGIIT